MTKTLDDVYATRRENLTKVLQHRGAKTQLAERLGTSQAHISHMLKAPQFPGSKRIPELTARQIEEAIGLDPKALDRPADFEINTSQGVVRIEIKKPPKRDFASSTAEHVTDVVETQAHNVSLLESAVHAVVSSPGSAKLDPSKIAKLTRLVYEHSQAAGRVDAQYVETLIMLAQ
jgi:hypothetical protein